MGALTRRLGKLGSLAREKPVQARSVAPPRRRESEPSMRLLPHFTEVESKPVHWFLRPFVRKYRRWKKRGWITNSELGRYTGRPLYTVDFDDGTWGVYFGNEFRVIPKQKTASGETIH